MARIYRVVVRGQFDGLDDDTRRRLLAEAADHDIFGSSFTADGTFTYDERLVSWNLRYELRLPDDHDGDDPQAAAVDLSIDRARAWLDSVGLPHKHVRATAADMAAMWRDR